MSDEDLADFPAGVQFSVIETMFGMLAIELRLRKEEFAWKWLKWLGKKSDE